MELSVTEIKEQGANLQVEESAMDFPVLAQLAKDEGYVFPESLTVALSAYVVGGIVELSGQLTVKVEIPCGRCLAPTLHTLKSDFAQSYVNELPQVSGEDGEEIELSAEEMGLELIDGDVIDLTDEIQQQVVLLLPTHPLCSQQCKGLCIECGVDLNKEKCQCADKKVSMHFAGLKDLKVEK